MIILTTAFGYGADKVRPFFNSLQDSGFTGTLAVMSDNCSAAKWLQDRGALLLPNPGNKFPINTRRFMAYKEYLRDKTEPTIITDIRDVVFQKNPEEHMPLEGVNVFQEYEEMNISSCPYNSKWMRDLGVSKWGHRPIICAGVTSGVLGEYTTALWEALRDIQSIVGLDQAAHIHLAYSGRVEATIHANEEGSVYTVGYLPRESVNIGSDGLIRNKAGEIPCIVHQYDRHENLKKGLKWQ